MMLLTDTSTIFDVVTAVREQPSFQDVMGINGRFRRAVFSTKGKAVLFGWIFAASKTSVGFIVGAGRPRL
jgi:hypothetical protein